jgi:plasmid stabilization system protein ParE
MRIVFLATTAPDFEWITDYYLRIFPEGGPKAYRRLDRALSNLSDNPYLGKAIARTKYRQYSVPRTPFSLIYHVSAEVIEILHIWDQRSNPLDLSLEDGMSNA